ncbi:tRNA (guanosine(37)-N1)-methyltransferase TrmD [Stomatobaculum longum]|jgi:tRNA (guanine-N(1)-)-methyltransferase|uniref:tRNA (guanosine(37)-N1)-methyltransferase TrmD n=1 Tax=Stomatobaculum longum TaxID=796942 RepID=UPI00280B66B5|nr:tRNA (guanosine(37)-N1)-methyltransferase TrmD [Stomatobaculum longum]
MRFTVLTLFPDMIRQGLSTSILGRAEERGFISFDIRNIRDYTTERHGHVDDAPYGGGAGMLMQADPILRCYRSATADLPKAPRVIYVTPQGRQFTQADAKMFAAEETLLILCGHYEGVDERALELLGAEPYSIGDYVLTGGELPAMVMVDAISRMVPGVLSNQESGEIESFEGNLLEYPQYTRPEVYEGLRVPPVLLSGDHKKVAQWRREQALLRTRERRPDLFAKVELNKADRKFLQAQAEQSADES